MPNIPTESELLDGLNSYTAHGDELAKLSELDWDVWFDGEGVTKDFLTTRDQPNSQER